MRIKIFVLAAILIFIVAIIFAFGGKNKPETENNPIAIEKYDITGTWYSDRLGGDTLALDKDGNYTSSKWIAQGKYALVGNNLTLTDMFGDSKELILTNTGNVYTLQYAGSAAHTYYRTEQEVKAAQEAAAAADEEMQSIYDAALSQILTTGEWKDSYGATAFFTEDSIAFKTATGKAVDYTYQVVSFEVKSGNYYLVMNCKDTTNGKDYKDAAFNLIVGDDNTYTLKSNGHVSQEFRYEYKKTVEIDFTQPVSTTGSVTDQERIDANSTADRQSQGTAGSTGDRVVIGEDGSIDHITQISREDNPDDSEQIEAAYKAIETAIYGKWQGTFEDFERADTVYWLFTFNKDGTYSFNDDEGNKEAGTFILGRNKDEASYISNMTLTPNSGEVYTLNFTLTGNLSNLRFDNYNIEKSYPTFEKK